MSSMKPKHITNGRKQDLIQNFKKPSTYLNAKSIKWCKLLKQADFFLILFYLNLYSKHLHTDVRWIPKPVITAARYYIKRFIPIVTYCFSPQKDCAEITICGCVLVWDTVHKNAMLHPSLMQNWFRHDSSLTATMHQSLRQEVIKFYYFIFG